MLAHQMEKVIAELVLPDTQEEIIGLLNLTKMERNNGADILEGALLILHMHRLKHKMEIT